MKTRSPILLLMAVLMISLGLFSSCEEKEEPNEHTLTLTIQSDGSARGLAPGELNPHGNATVEIYGSEDDWCSYGTPLYQGVTDIMGKLVVMNTHLIDAGFEKGDLYIYVYDESVEASNWRNIHPTYFNKENSSEQNITTTYDCVVGIYSISTRYLVDVEINAVSVLDNMDDCITDNYIEIKRGGKSHAHAHQVLIYEGADVCGENAAIDTLYTSGLFSNEGNGIGFSNDFDHVKYGNTLTAYMEDDNETVNLIGTFQDGSNLTSIYTASGK